MEKEYKKVTYFIADCYKNNTFDSNIFKFYQGRSTKGKFRTGIINYHGKLYFFKIVDKDEYNMEDDINDRINPFFKTVDKYYELNLGEDIINLYQYIDAVGINSFNYLRSNDISFDEKRLSLETFFKNVISIQDKYIYKDYMDGSCKSDRWFIDRIIKGERITDYYGNNVYKLLEDIKRLCPEFLNNFKNYLINLYEYLDEPNKTILTYSHGDFHDFNFSLNGVYWDTDTFGFNPILNDLAIYLWHFYAREDYLIYSYSPWLIKDMHNNLNECELNKIRDLKKKEIINWLKITKDYFKSEHLENNYNKEFIYKLFCRIFLIDNITLYSDEDKIKVFSYFNYILEHSNEDIIDITLNNPTSFVLKNSN